MNITMGLKKAAFFLALVLGWSQVSLVGTPEVSPADGGRLKAYASASFIPGRIDLVVIPKPFNMLLEEEDVAYNGWRSHIPKNGRFDLVRHGGTDHYLPWDYDAHIPLILFGPPRILHGESQSRVSLRDVVPTLCRILGIPTLPFARGQVLAEALSPLPSIPPRLILLIVIDQGGWVYLNAHPGQHPFLSELMDTGFVFREAWVDHGPAATAVSHAVLGTGAFPREHGVNDNKPFWPGLNQSSEIYEGPQGLDPGQLSLPTVADVWAQWTSNQARVFAYSSASRAAVGMAGHGADFKGNDRGIVFWYDLKSKCFVTSERQFRMPEILRNWKVEDYRRLNQDDPLWSGQDGLYKDGRTYDKLWIGSPGFARFEGDALEAALGAENKVGTGPVTDLVFINLKATDYSGHYMGAESLESGRTLAEVDRSARRVFNALMSRTGGNMVTLITADHGVAPLTELSGGRALWKDDLARDVEARFGGGNGRRVVKRVYRNGLCLDLQALKAAGHSLAEVQAFLREYKVDGKLFFEAVFRSDELE